jgi:transposase-like protein
MSMKNLRKYDREFKLNAVKLYQESGKKLAEIAQNLGIPKSTLNVWIHQFKENGEKSFPGSGVLKPCNEELYRLRRELLDVKQERDILKKAVAIFSKPKG